MAVSVASPSVESLLEDFPGSPEIRRWRTGSDDGNIYALEAGIAGRCHAPVGMEVDEILPNEYRRGWEWDRWARLISQVREDSFGLRHLSHSVDRFTVVDFAWRDTMATYYRDMQMEQKGRSSVEFEIDGRGLKAQEQSGIDAVAPYGSKPPSYDEALLDAPPDYTTTNELATVRLWHDTANPPPYASNWPSEQDTKQRSTVDFSSREGIREHASKKAKQAARRAQQAKLFDSDNEDNKRDGAGNGDDNGNGGEGAGNGGDNNGDGGDGDGGDPPGGGGGGGGGDDEEENLNNNKKKKKKDKKKKEDEEEQTAQNGGEDVVQAQVDPWPAGDAAGDANPDDEWAVQTNKGKKKGKKGKGQEPMPPPPPPPPAGPTSNLPPTMTAVDNTAGDRFDDIVLDDNEPKIGEVPTIDINFGNTETKNTGGGFGLSNLVSGWGDGGRKWSFGAIGASTTVNENDGKSSSNANPWTMGSGKKDKQVVDTGFSAFDFGNLAGNNNGVKETNGETAPQDKDDADEWNEFAKKDRKKKNIKKTAAAEQQPVDPPSEPVQLQEPNLTPAIDSWLGGWVGKEKKKKKGEAEENNVVQPLEAEAQGGASMIATNIWPSFESGKKDDKKNNKKVKDDEKTDMQSLGTEVPAEASTMTTNIWGAPEKRGKKKNNKKEAEQERNGMQSPETEQPIEPSAATNMWPSFATNKKNDKKNKNGAVEPEVVEDQIISVGDNPAVEVVARAVEDDLMSYGTTKKNKKGRKGANPKADPTTQNSMAPPPEPSAGQDTAEDTKFDDGLSTWGTSKKGRKSKDKAKDNNAIVPVPEVDDNAIVSIVDEAIADLNNEDGQENAEVDWSSWGIGGGDKKNNEKNQGADLLETNDNDLLNANGLLNVNNVVQEHNSNFGMWSTTKKEKKKKRTGSTIEVPPPVPTPPKQGLTPGSTPPASTLAVVDSVTAGNIEGRPFNLVNSKSKKKASKQSTSDPDNLLHNGSNFDGFNTGVGAYGDDHDFLAIVDEADQGTENGEDDIIALGESTPDPDSVIEKEEEPPKPTKSYWSFGTSSTKKTAKEKEKQEKEKAKAEKERVKKGEKERKEREEKEREEREREEQEAKEREEREAEEKAAKEQEQALARERAEKKRDVGKKNSKANNKSGAMMATKLDDSTTKIINADINFNTTTELDDHVTNPPLIDFLTEETAPEPRIADKSSGINKIAAKTEQFKAKGEVWNYWGPTSRKTSTKTEEAKVTGTSKGGSATIITKNDDQADKSLTTTANNNYRHKTINNNTTRDDDVKEVNNDNIEPSNELEHTETPPSLSRTASASLATAKKSSPSITNVKRQDALDKKKSSSVAERIKALENKKEASIDRETTSKGDKKTAATSKTKGAGLKSGKAKEGIEDTQVLKEVDEDATPAVEHPVEPLTIVPGSFPDEIGEDDFIDFIPEPPRPNNEKNKKGAKESPMESIDQVLPTAPSPPPEPGAVEPEPQPDPETMPTPPPEVTPAPKAIKKERPRVVREEPSWGFWGTASKKDTKSKAQKAKDDSALPSPGTPKTKDTATGLVRSKSVKKPSEKEAEKQSSNSSSSDKDKERGGTKPERRASKVKGMTLSNIFGAVSTSPRRTTPRRESTAVKTESKQRDVEVDDTGLLSPDLDDELAKPRGSAKAAKLLGTSEKTAAKLAQRESSMRKGKKPAMNTPISPPPVEEDIVVVDQVDDLLEDSPIPPPVNNLNIDKGKSNEKAKQSKSSAEGDDLVMIDEPTPSGPSDSGPGSNSRGAPESPRTRVTPMKRSSTSARKGEGLMGLFGSLRPKATRGAESGNNRRRKSTVDERPSSNSRRATRQTGSDGDEGRRIRRELRKIERSPTKLEMEGDGTSTERRSKTDESKDGEDLEAREARRAERRARRAIREAEEREAREAEERRARRREAEKQALEAKRAKAREAKERQIREQEEREAQRRKERSARRAAREDRLIRGEEFRKAGDSKDLERRDEKRGKRRERDKEFEMSGGLGEGPSTRARRSHRRSYQMDVDSPTPRSSRRKEVRSDRRKSAPVTSEPIQDYFDPRNGEGEGVAGPSTNDPHIEGMHQPGTDHTSSWVNSQLAEPPAPPPVEPTVIEAPINHHATNKEDNLVEEDAVRREARRSKRRSRVYAEESPQQRGKKVRRADDERQPAQESNRRRRSGGGGIFEEGRSSRRMTTDYSSPTTSPGMKMSGIRTFDGRPTTTAGGNNLFFDTAGYGNGNNKRSNSGGSSGWWKGLGAKIIAGV